MNRRDTVFALLAACTICRPLVAGAQAPRKVWRIGGLSTGSAPDPNPYGNELRRGLREAGFLEERDYEFEWRDADGNNERLAAHAGELVRLNVDVILTDSTNAAKAAQKATATIPIVFVGVGGDPIAAGFANSLARPGRNMTGLSNFAADLTPKRMELLKLAIPKLSRIALLLNPGNPYYGTFVPQTRSAANAIGVTVAVVDWNTVDDINPAIAKAARDGAQGIMISADILHFEHRKQICDAANKYRIASMSPLRQYAEAGCLMTYGANVLAQYRQIAAFLGKIMKGAKPADLPIEQPTTFELVVNVKAAKAVGITIPMEILRRADEVIQ